MIRCISIFLLLIVFNENSFCQKDSIIQFKNIVIKKKTKRDWGKEIIRKAIGRRKEVEKNYSNFEVDIYSISKIDKEKKDSLENTCYTRRKRKLISFTCQSIAILNIFKKGILRLRLNNKNTKQKKS